MSKPEKPSPRSFPEGSRVDRKQRLSLQPKSDVETPPGALRHTQSHRYDSQGKKKKKTVSTSQISSIIEADNSDDELEKSVEVRIDKGKSSVVYENDKRSSGRSTKSKSKETTSKPALAFDNAAFEGNLYTKRNSAANSSSRAPSVQSLEIVREQYCCCAKRTKCERILLTIVIVLVIIIIVLVVVIIFVAQHDNLKDLTSRLSL